MDEWRLELCNVCSNNVATYQSAPPEPEIIEETSSFSQTRPNSVASRSSADDILGGVECLFGLVSTEFPGCYHVRKGSSFAGGVRL